MLQPEHFTGGPESGKAARREHTRATVELRRAMYRIAVQAGRLENLHLMRFEDYLKTLAAWKAGKGVEKVQRPEEGVQGGLRLIS